MRISEHEKKVIIESVQEVDINGKVWLFGSRTDDNKKGGDIDLAVLSKKIHADIMKKIKINRSICNKIGEQKIDILTSDTGKEAIFRLAMEEGIELI